MGLRGEELEIHQHVSEVGILNKHRVKEEFASLESKEQEMDG